jgi:hypothetical protein
MFGITFGFIGLAVFFFFVYGRLKTQAAQIGTVGSGKIEVATAASAVQSREARR